MSYSRRFSLAMLAAAAIVVGMFASAPSVLRRIDAIAMLPPPERPIQLDLRDLEPAPPPEPEPVKRLIDAGAPTDEPVQETDLISSQASRAQDMSDAEGDPSRPAAQEVDDFDQLAAATPAPAPPAPEVTPPMPEESPAVQEPAEPTPPVEEKPEVEPAPAVEETGTSAPEMPEPAKNEEAAKPKLEEKKAEKVAAEKPAESKPVPEPFKVAQATPPPAPVLTQELHSEKGRKGGGAERSGNTSFEANKHALGEYMLGVRSRVERAWRSALHLRYSGSSRTDAVIHCVIRPDGTIESVSIVDAGQSLTYAVLCREAVEAAGPFAPFPFDVPEIYRTDDLEINWRFSYM